MENFEFSPIGYIKTCFSKKNGTPRQPTVSASSKGQLKILKSIFNNPEHSLDGLSNFSHIWIVFVFHLNSYNTVRAKVKPPRMDGAKCGVFSTRSPHRPNALGLTLAKLDFVRFDTLYVSGIDIVDNTPVLDVKPFIAYYDQPQVLLSTLKTSNCDESKCKKEISSTVINPSDCKETLENHPIVKIEHSNLQSKLYNEIDVQGQSYVASWVFNPPISQLNVIFSNRALGNLKKFCSATNVSDVTEENSDWVLQYLRSEDLQKVIVDILQADPRSSYRRNKCSDRLYYFTVDIAHVTAWFDEVTVPHSVEIIRVIPKKFVDCDQLKISKTQKQSYSFEMKGE